MDPLLDSVRWFPNMMGVNYPDAWQTGLRVSDWSTARRQPIRGLWGDGEGGGGAPHFPIKHNHEDKTERMTNQPSLAFLNHGGSGDPLGVHAPPPHSGSRTRKLRPGNNTLNRKFRSPQGSTTPLGVHGLPPPQGHGRGNHGRETTLNQKFGGPQGSTPSPTLGSTPPRFTSGKSRTGKNTVNRKFVVHRDP